MAGISASCLNSTCAKLFISSAKTEIDQRVQLPENTKNSRVLVLGGTGRVGGSTALALSKLCPELRIVIAGRNREKGAAMVSKLGERSEFAEVDIDDRKSLEAALNNVDLVVHAAGPFQQVEKCTVLEAAIETKVRKGNPFMTAYIDVCDDMRYSRRAKSFNDKALDANIQAITTAGIYPGVSNVMAAELVRAAKSESDGETEPKRLRFFYYTAGTGGAGPTILATSFLLLGEEVVAYNKGEIIKLKPYSSSLNIDFGKGIGKRDVYLLNLPEVSSAHEVHGIPTVSARFGTSPFFWNWGMEAMTKLFPAEFLRDRSKVQQLVQLFDPVVRVFDGIAGERVSMRVDLECSNGRTTIGLYSHKRLSVSVGTSTAAFVLAMLEGSTQPGVWFPEEPEGIAIEARELLLKRASQGTFNFIMNKSNGSFMCLKIVVVDDESQPSFDATGAGCQSAATLFCVIWLARSLEWHKNNNILGGDNISSLAPVVSNLMFPDDSIFSLRADVDDDILRFIKHYEKI